MCSYALVAYQATLDKARIGYVTTKTALEEFTVTRFYCIMMHVCLYGGVLTPLDM